MAAQLPNILAGRSYINFHTSQFPGGEVRGQILAVTAVPEPETTALVAIGLAMLAVWTRRRQATDAVAIGFAGLLGLCAAQYAAWEFVS